MAAEMEFKNSIAVIGASGHGMVVRDCVLANFETMNFVGFFDDNTNLQNIIGNVADIDEHKEYSYIVAIGDAKIRESIVNAHYLNWATVIHPSAVVSPSAKIGEGTVVMPGAIINARAKIGRHCIINSGAIIEHDNVIEDFAHISVGAKLGGNVHVGKSTWVGIGAVVKNNINIYDYCTIGAGSVVIRDVPENAVVAGVPAQVIKYKEQKSACGKGGFQNSVS